MKKICIFMTVVLCLSLLGGCSVDITVRDENGSSIAIPDGVESAIENIINNATSTTGQGTESTTVSGETSGTQNTTPAKSTGSSKSQAGSTSKSQTPSSSATTKVVQNGAKYITGISINKMPQKTEYITGDKQLNTTGLVINRLYNDGSSDTTVGGFKIIGFNTKSPGKKTLTIVYEHENGSVLLCEYTINVTKKQHGTPNIQDNFHHDMEDEILELINEERTKAGLKALKMDHGKMMNAADIRAKEITVDFAHERPDHDEWDTVYDEEGVGYKLRGENLGNSGIPADGSSATQGIFNTWMNSPSHKKNIMDPSFTHVSVACLEYNGNYYWAQLFGANA